MLGASLCFALMSVCVKFAAPYFTTFELVGYRGLVAVVVLLMLARSQHQSMRTHLPWGHAWRVFVGVTSLVGWFYALGNLPIATGMTLNYTSSLWIAAFLILSGWFKRSNPVKPIMLATVITGFVGVMLILQPTISQDQWWHGFVGLVSGAIAALAYLQVAHLGKAGEPDIRIVFYFALGSFVTGLVATLFTGFSTPGWSAFKWVLPIGITATAGQLMLTRAYSKGSTLLVANLQYAGIVFSCILGVWIFNEQLSSTAWLGILLVIAGGIGASYSRLSANRPSKPSPQ